MEMFKQLAIIILVISLGLGIYKLAEIYSPGSYPNVEKYGLDISEPKLISAINQFKKLNPQYNPPINFGLKDGYANSDSHWYNVYFYYKESKDVVFIWLRKKDWGGCTIGLVGINKGDLLGSWKDINGDFDDSENLAQKRKFENLILDPIKKLVEERKYH